MPRAACTGVHAVGAMQAACWLLLSSQSLSRALPYPGLQRALAPEHATGALGEIQARSGSQSPGPLLHLQLQLRPALLFCRLGVCPCCRVPGFPLTPCRTPKCVLAIEPAPGPN